MEQTTKHIQINAFGPAENLKLVQRKIDKIQPSEVLVKVEAAGVNFSDILRRKNTYFMPTPLPFIPGTEAVGTIISKGDKVEALHQGMRVLAILPAGGGYAEYTLASSQYCIPLPEHVDAKTASALFVQGSTAHLMISQLAGDIKGKTVLVHAASGGVGSLLVQLANMKGAKVIATASSESKLDSAKSLGADIGVNYTEINWPEKLIEKNQGEKVDLIFEMVGGEIYTKSFEVLKGGGKMIVYGAASGEKGYIHSEHFVDEGLQLLGFNLAYFIQHRMEDWQASLGAMIELVAGGKIKVLFPNVYALADAAQAHQDIEDRKTSGKVVLIP